MGFFSSSKTTKASPKTKTVTRKQLSSTNTKTKKKVHFTDISNIKHEYEFDWDLEREYWFSKEELKGMNTVRFDDADILRKERGIRTASRNDADEFTESRRNLFIGDKITNALDDCDDNHEVSIRGIEHFVFPVLQKEMVRRKKELKMTVLGYSRDPVLRKKDPNGIKLAEESANHSKWARDVATERGIKYCQMKRGAGRGGGLLATSKQFDKPRRGSFFKNNLSMDASDDRDDS